MVDEEQLRARARLGRILTTIGSIWFVLVILSNVGLLSFLPFNTSFLSNSFFIPLAMIFSGRVIRRRTRQVEEAGPPRSRPAPTAAQ